MTEEKEITITLSTDIIQKIQKRIDSTSFSSVADYISYMVVKEFPTDMEYSEEEEKVIRERLRKLGYIE